MKRVVLVSLIACSCIAVVHQAIAQTSKTKKSATAKSAPAANKKMQLVDVRLGDALPENEVVSKRVFDSLAKRKLQVVNGGRVQGFTFTYAEHNLYEDSAGNPLRQVDYLVEYCLGDSLSAGVKSSLFERTKPGDTAYFSEIKVLTPGGVEARGKTLKYVLTR